jgi:hypothetical protein
MTERIVFLYERSMLDTGELDAVRTATPWMPMESILGVRAGDLVIARHYTWPWPRRLDRDLAAIGAHALNAARDYDYCDNPMRWATDLGDLTPETWEDFSLLPDRGPFFLKGPKADKGRWDRCYAETRAEAITLRRELQRDTGMRGEHIVARRYVPLERLGDGLGGVPPAVEFRLFVLDGRVVSRGFYWPPDDCETPPPSPEVIPEAFVERAIARVGSVDGRAPRWYALDVARTTTGDWVVVEINDGQRSGLSENDPRALYAAMAASLAAPVVSP